MNSVILATAGYDHKIYFWEPPSGVCSRTLRYSDSQVNCLRITPDKHYLAAAGNPNVRLFDINSQNLSPVVAYDGHTTNVTDIGFQKDGKWMYTASEDGTVKIWDLRAPGCQRNYDCGAPVNTVALHPNQQAELVTGDQRGRVKAWDLSASKSADVPTGAASDDLPIQSIAMASDASLLVAANNRGTVFVFDAVGGGGKGYALSRKFKAHDGYLLKCVLGPNVRHLVTTSSDKTAKVWNVGGNWELDKTLASHQRWVWDAVFSADSSYLVTASSDHSAKLWELRSGEVIRNYVGHSNAVTCVALNDSST
ncbi:unnamed protein product [Phaeothamnion confervicola]